METESVETEIVIFIIFIEEITNILQVYLLFLFFFKKYFLRSRRLIGRRKRKFGSVSYRWIHKIPDQIKAIRELVELSDVTCVEQLRMDRNAFCRLCFLLENVGDLRATRNVPINEQVAIFLSILAHHKKIRVVKYNFKRSGHTISKRFNEVLDAVLRLFPILASDPKPVDNLCPEAQWKWFKGCLGALDGTYVKVRVPLVDQPRYRNRKGELTVIVLGVCDRDMKFVFVLSGWEGSAADSRVLRDAIARASGLKIPTGNYYLADSGYTNGPGFLTPYRGVRYHLKEWDVGSGAPRNYKELFNLRHAKAHNVIERSFGLLKIRWDVLRSCSFYNISIQNKIIMACCLLQNFISSDMSVDPLENVVVEEEEGSSAGQLNNDDFVDQVEPSHEWTNWRDTLAINMYNEWLASQYNP